MTIPAAAGRLLGKLLAAGGSVAVAESCTGGEVLAALTGQAGASDCVWGGAVVYGAEAKTTLAGLTVGDLQHGVVSAPTTEALAEAIRRRASTTLGLAVTGWAGPSADGPDPVGTVYLAVAGPGQTTVTRHELSGDRAQVRRQAVSLLLDLAVAFLEEPRAEAGPYSKGSG